jgi:hypothetical protein
LILRNWDYSKKLDFIAGSLMMCVLEESSLLCTWKLKPEALRVFGFFYRRHFASPAPARWVATPGNERCFTHPLSRCTTGVFALSAVREYETDDLYAHTEGKKQRPDPDILRGEKHQQAAKYEQ